MGLKFGVCWQFHDFFFMNYEFVAEPILKAPILVVH